MSSFFGSSSTASDEQATAPAELFRAFDDVETAWPRNAPLGIDLWTLARFKASMVAEGWPVQTARMIFDRVYAHERLALGHTSNNGDLRALSLDIFRRIHANDGLQH